MEIKDGAKFLKFIKEQGCLICGKMPVDADHLKTIGMGGNRKRPNWNDFSCVPLCRLHHIERHNNMEKTEKEYRVNFWKENHRYLMRWLRDSAVIIKDNE